MKVVQPTRKQLILGISLAAALGLTAIAYQRSNNRLLSILIGTGAYSLLSATTEKGAKKLKKRAGGKSEGEKKLPKLSIALEKYQRGDLQDSEEELRDLEQHDPEGFNDGAGVYLLGIILEKLGKENDAIHYLRQFTKGQVSQPEELIRLADLLLKNEELEEAIETYTRAIELDETNSRVIFNRGVAFALQDNFSRAYEDCKTASEMGNEGARESLEKIASYVEEELTEENFTRLVNEGDELRREGLLAKCKVCYDKAINVGIQLANIPTKVSEAYEARAATQLQAGNNSLAAEDYEKAIRYSEEISARAAAGYGRALSLLGRNEEAITYYNVAIIKEPSQATYFERGNSKTKMNRAEEAIEDYNLAIELGTDEEVTQMSYANRGCCSAFMNKPLEAEKDLLKSIELNPGDTSAREHLSRTYSELGRLEEAFAQLSCIIEIDCDYNQAYRLRGMLSLARYEYNQALADLKKYSEITGGDEKTKKYISYIKEKLATLIDPNEMLEPSDNLEEWRSAQALLSRNAAFIQTYERYLEKLGQDEAAKEFIDLSEQLRDEYLTQIRVSAKYKDAYCMFRLRNLTYATMAINMNGESLEDREAFGKYFLHPIFDDADTIYRELIRGDEIDRQIKQANMLEDYVVYGCSVYCNTLLNLIDDGSRERRDTGKNFEEFLNIQGDIEDQNKVDEIFTIREAMTWTIASTDADLVTSGEESDKFEVRALELLSKTNRYRSDYGNGPYRREDIIDAIMNHSEWLFSSLDLDNKQTLLEEYRSGLGEMPDTELAEEALGDSPLSLRDYLNKWGQQGAQRFVEPNLKSDRLVPSQSSEVKKYYSVNYDDGLTSHRLARFEELHEARRFLRSQLDLFTKKEGMWSEIKFLGNEDEDFDFEIAEIDQEGDFIKQAFAWWPGDELPNMD